MVPAEDVGHVLGALAGLILMLATENWAVTVGTAAALATVVALLGGTMKSTARI
jgi:hypothetical protein